MLLLYIFTNLTITRKKSKVCIERNDICFRLIVFFFLEYVQRFATPDMADSLSSSINGQSSSNNSSSNNSSNQTNGSSNSNQTNKNESDDEVLSDFSEDETANMDLE
jgi:hypothetical protein